MSLHELMLGSTEIQGFGLYHRSKANLRGLPISDLCLLKLDLGLWGLPSVEGRPGGRVDPLVEHHPVTQRSLTLEESDRMALNRNPVLEEGLAL